MKKNRQKVIIELVKTKRIETQEELAEALRDQGFQVTQATVSRDIRNLNLTKVSGSDGRQHYTILEQQENTVKK
ncbi:MAG: arginine repressor, partial [Lachnospiraceae bacterium]|nr:arginine repressor [Lachnospiraceae bacterium]